MMNTSQKQIAAFSLVGGVMLIILSMLIPGNIFSAGRLPIANAALFLGIVFCAIGLFTILRARRS